MKNLSQSTTSYTIENTLTTASFSVQCTPDKCPILRQLIEEKEKEIARLREENQQLAKSLEQLTGTKNLYSHMIFGRSTEKTSETQAIAPSEKTPVQDSLVPSNDNDDKTVPATGDNPPEPDIPHNNVHHISRHPKRKRGAQPGHKGHGRTIPEDLPVIRKIIKVPEEERFCPICGKEGVEVPFTENSTQIEVKLELFRVEYVRERIKRTCDCVYAGNRFITAPQPPHAIEKSKFGHNLLSLLVVLKY